MMKTCFKLITRHGKRYQGLLDVSKSGFLQRAPAVYIVKHSFSSSSSTCDESMVNVGEGSPAKGVNDDWEWIPPVRFREDGESTPKPRRHKLAVIEKCVLAILTLS